MAQLANIVVPDAATTPVNHTFVGQKVSAGQAMYQEKSAAFPLGYWPLTSVLREPVGSSGKVYKFTASLAIPQLKTYTDLSGNQVTVVDYVHRYNMEALLPVNGTLQNRKDARKLFVGILGDAQFTDQLENLNFTN